MSEHLGVVHGAPEDEFCCSYMDITAIAGGRPRGPCVQLTIGGQYYIQLTGNETRGLANILNEWLKEHGY